MVVHFILLCRLDEAVVMSGDVGCWGFWWVCLRLE